MAKKKTQQKASVPNPKIGTKYHYLFAGSWQYGPIIRVSESLSKIYGYPYFWLTDDEDPVKDGDQQMTYPVSIYNIFKDKKDVR